MNNANKLIQRALSRTISSKTGRFCKWNDLGGWYDQFLNEANQCSFQAHNLARI
jgi:hypothetical protein